MTDGASERSEEARMAADAQLAPGGFAATIVLSGISIGALQGPAPGPMNLRFEFSADAEAIVRGTPTFGDAADYVLVKNAELYRRLS